MTVKDTQISQLSHAIITFHRRFRCKEIPNKSHSLLIHSRKSLKPLTKYFLQQILQSTYFVGIETYLIIWNMIPNPSFNVQLQ